jgi:hypothetical protein
MAGSNRGLAIIDTDIRFKLQLDQGAPCIPNAVIVFQAIDFLRSAGAFVTFCSRSSYPNLLRSRCGVLSSEPRMANAVCTKNAICVLMM